jgi:hypothetical protein
MRRQRLKYEEGMLFRATYWRIIRALIAEKICRCLKMMGPKFHEVGMV